MFTIFASMCKTCTQSSSQLTTRLLSFIFLAFLNLRHFLKIKKKITQQKGGPRPARPTPKSAPDDDSFLAMQSQMVQNSRGILKSQSTFQITLMKINTYDHIQRRITITFNTNNGIHPNFNGQCQIKKKIRFNECKSVKFKGL